MSVITAGEIEPSEKRWIRSVKLNLRTWSLYFEGLQSHKTVPHNKHGMVSWEKFNEVLEKEGSKQRFWMNEKGGVNLSPVPGDKQEWERFLAALSKAVKATY